MLPRLGLGEERNFKRGKRGEEEKGEVRKRRKEGRERKKRRSSTILTSNLASRIGM